MLKKLAAAAPATAPKHAKNGTQEDSKSTRARSQSIEQGTGGGGDEAEGAMDSETSSKQAGLEEFSKETVTQLFSFEESLLNDPFEAFVFVSFVHLDSRYFLAHMEAEDNVSNAMRKVHNPHTWLSMKAKMDLEYCETDHLAKLYAGKRGAGQPEGQEWYPSTVTFANWPIGWQKTTRRRFVKLCRYCDCLGSLCV